MTDRPPLPPFDRESALTKVQAAEDAWNTRDPERVASAYTVDSAWRNRDAFFTGRAAIIEFLTAKWNRELDYALRKNLWSFGENRIAVRFQYESHDAQGRWWRSYGNELWEFDEHGLMRHREARSGGGRADHRGSSSCGSARGGVGGGEPPGERVVQVASGRHPDPVGEQGVETAGRLQAAGRLDAGQDQAQVNAAGPAGLDHGELLSRTAQADVSLLGRQAHVRPHGVDHRHELVVQRPQGCLLPGVQRVGHLTRRGRSRARGSSRGHSRIRSRSLPGQQRDAVRRAVRH